jgi:hypothetical protein
MKNKIIINEIIVEEFLIKVVYEVVGEWKKYFSEEVFFWYEYSSSILNTPKSIAVIPFLCNILPIAWICDAEINLEEVDKTFYDSIEQFKVGYIQMYKNINFKGHLYFKKIIDNFYDYKKTSATLFSGGVDAFSTLISNFNEKPDLITIWGADIHINNEKGWNNTINQIEKTSKDFGLKTIYIKSNFRLIINESRLDQLVKKSGDGWWHGFQHGIGLIGHSAPYAYKENIQKIYIASSFTVLDKGIVTCASDPSIDNFLKFGSTNVSHDGYEYTRQKKVENICEFSRNENKKLFLRVCFKTSTGENCCRCEKCYRTMFSILAEGGEPNDFGFQYESRNLGIIKTDLKHKIDFNFISIPFWEEIKRRFKFNRHLIKDSSLIELIEELNFKGTRIKYKSLIKRIINKVKKYF